MLLKMTTENNNPKSLIEQIIEDMFSKLKDRAEYNVQVIDKLSKVASTGDLTSTKKIIDAIKT